MISKARADILAVFRHVNCPVLPGTIMVATGRSSGSVYKNLSLMARDGQVQRIYYGMYILPEWAGRYVGGGQHENN